MSASVKYVAIKVRLTYKWALNQSAVCGGVCYSTKSASEMCPHKHLVSLCVLSKWLLRLQGNGEEIIKTGFVQFILF